MPLSNKANRTVFLGEVFTKAPKNNYVFFCFNLILECSRLQHELKTQGEKDEPKV